MNKDQFGYYLVGGLKTYSKIEALEYAHLVNSPVKWIFNDDVFSKYPWHIDTQEDIKNLYRKRAEQIRNKYDYIILWYSGGVDSFTMANTFHESNIHVDEIAQYHAHEGEKTWDSYLNKEVETVAIPQTQEFLSVMPHTKHRTVDLTPIIKSVFDMDNNRFDFMYYSNKSFAPNQLARTYLREKISDWAGIIASGKKLCFVWGTDRPPINYDAVSDRYYFLFKDIIDGAGVGPRTQILNREEEHDELFYWSPDSMYLMARQGHIIKNYLRNPPKEDLDSRYLTSDPNEYAMAYNGDIVQSYTRPAATRIKNKMYYLTTHGLNRLIYPDWKESTFVLGKQLSNIFNIRDRWWFEEYQDKDQKMFIGAIQSYYKKFNRWGFNFFKKSQHSDEFRHINIDLFHSKKYYLEL